MNLMLCSFVCFCVVSTEIAGMINQQKKERGVYILIHGGFNNFDSRWDEKSSRETSPNSGEGRSTNYLFDCVRYVPKIVREQWRKLLDLWGEYRINGASGGIISYFSDNYRTFADVLHARSGCPVETFKWLQIFGVTEFEKSYAASCLIDFIRDIKKKYTALTKIILVGYCCAGDVIWKATHKKEFDEFDNIEFTVNMLDMPNNREPDRGPTRTYY